MKKSKEELTRIHKEKCRELKKLRDKMPEDHYVVKLPIIPGYSGKAEAADSLRKLQKLGIQRENVAIFHYLIP